MTIKNLGKVIKIISVITCIAIIITIIPNLFARADESAISSLTSDSIKDKEQQISDAKIEKEELKDNITNLEGILDDLEDSKKELSNYVVELDASLEAINDKVEELNTLIAQKQVEIEEIQVELDIAVDIERVQGKAMRDRIEAIYKRDDFAFWDMLYSVNSFSDMLNKLSYVEIVSEYDRDTMETYIEVRENIATIKKTLEAEQEVLYEAQAVQQEEQENMEILISEKGDLIEQYESDINNKEAYIKALESDMEAEEKLIKALELQVAEERRHLAESSGLIPTYDGGRFAWPAPEYTRITSDFGMRKHPVYGYAKMHNGVDMAAPYGTPILAAYDGKVADTGYHYSMGNYVLIDHGNGIFTVYMHASKIYTKEDALVVRGEKIAAVGSTGTSTGNHLHFGVRKDGVYVSPWSYLK